MDDRLKIGFFCAHDPYDRRSFSGTPSYMLDALGRRDDIVLRVLGPYRRGYRGKLLSAWRRWRKTPLRGPEAGAVKELDWVIVPVSSRFIPERRGAAGPKFVHVTDATPQFLRDFYARPTSRQADLVEQTALERADLVVYSSGYMAGRALAEFGGADAAKIHAISFGLNLDALPPPPGAKPPPDPLKLIFIGKNWQTKGGIIAAEANEILNRRGIASELTVIGGRPDDPSRYGNARFLGYLDKGRAKDYRLLTRSLSQAHLFVLPTQADCTPMVVAEANAHGVPAVINEIGGISSLVREGENGFLMDPGSDAAPYADKIARILSDRPGFDALAAGSYEYCRNNLTWDAWARDMIALIRRDPEKARHSRIAGREAG